MRDLARPGKADVVVIGEGITALLVAHSLAQAGWRTVLIREQESPPPPGPAEWPAVPAMGGAERRALARAGHRALDELAGHLPGLRAGEAEWLGADFSGHALPRRVPALWYDIGRLLPALATRAAEAGVDVVRTRVRGISVIEGRVLGVVTEARRWDARRLVLAVERAGRTLALTRMAQAPLKVPEITWPLRRLRGQGHGRSVRAGPSGLLWPAEGGMWLWGVLPGVEPDGPCLADVPLAPPDSSPTVGPAERVEGLWLALGTAGWPLVAAGAAIRLADEMLAA